MIVVLVRVDAGGCAIDTGGAMAAVVALAASLVYG